MNRDFLLLWQGQLVSQFGNQMYVIGLAFWVMDVTDSASLMGILMGMFAIPGLVIGPFAGTFADRHSRRAIIVASDFACGVLALALGAAFLWWPDATILLVITLAIVTIASSVARAFFVPAIDAAIADLVPRERLTAANAWLQGASAIVLIVGQAVGGVLYKAAGVAMLFLANGCTFLFSAGSESFMRLPHTPPDEQPTEGTLRAYTRETREGFRYVWNRKGLRQLVIASCVMVFASGPVAILFPFFVKNSLGRGADFYGFLMAALGAGAVLGFAIAGRIRPTGQAAIRVVSFSLLGVCGLVSLIGQLTTPLPALFTFFTLGVLGAMIQVFVRTLIQGTTPSRIRGRTVALIGTLVSGLAPLGMALGGILADLSGKNVPLIYGLWGAVSALTVLGAASRPEFRAFLSSFPSGPESPGGDIAEDEPTGNP